LGMLLEEHIAFLKQDDLTLDALLSKVPLPERAGVRLPPLLPPYFATVDRDRRARMFTLCAQPGPLQDRVENGWIPLFTPPPPPTYVPREAFMTGVNRAIQSRFSDAAAAVHRIQTRGGKVVFLRLPMSGPLKQLEDRATPRAGPWNQLLKLSAAPGIYFEDYPELASFVCPEWSHLSEADSILFTHRLIPHLRKALEGSVAVALPPA
jgi:hypothetical protein